MDSTDAASIMREIMAEFAALTGLSPPGTSPRRYLWTDAFAVCNFLELFRRTRDEAFLELGLRLVDQVHHGLGRHRIDDPRTGWISGLAEEEGERHPTIGGLRIGKGLNERGPAESADEQLEWDRDGQYYHYLTKWMHALCRVGQESGEPDYLQWALELARTAHARFTHLPPWENRQRLYWKMSIDLSRPLVSSMGQHDPLDGLLTCCELQAAAGGIRGTGDLPPLDTEIAELAGICQGKVWATGDPLGIGSLLADTWRIVQLMDGEGFPYPAMLKELLTAALHSLRAFTAGDPLLLPVSYRFPFRELGLAIGLHGAERLLARMADHPGLFDRDLRMKADGLQRYLPLSEMIERFWLDKENRKGESWREHREINMVMLATSLAPDGFLTV
ncbi:MAG TPA: hypothetical protein VF775_01270 [Geobacteraceae bacterium]